MKNKIKERMERILHGSILFTTLLTLAFPVQAWAKVGGNETEYTYTVTLCSGNQGYFSDTNGITVDNHITGSSYQIEKESQGEKIKISGLKYGEPGYGSGTVLYSAKGRWKILYWWNPGRPEGIIILLENLPLW